MDTGPEIEFSGAVVEWRGPAPYVFVPLPLDAADLVDEVKADVVYWGVVPVRAWIGDTEFTTAMFPREDTWFLPLKVAVRRAQRIELGDVVDVRMQVGG
jgi:leucyl aminopeptidase (aminopeptidase T)